MNNSGGQHSEVSSELRPHNGQLPLPKRKRIEIEQGSARRKPINGHTAHDLRLPQVCVATPQAQVLLGKIFSFHFSLKGAATPLPNAVLNQMNQLSIVNYQLSIDKKQTMLERYSIRFILVQNYNGERLFQTASPENKLI